MAAGIHRSPHSRSTGFHAPSRLHSSESGSAQDCERSVRVSLLLCLSRIQARHAALSGSSRNHWEHPNRHEWNSCPSRFSRRQKQLTKPKRELSQTLHLRVRRRSDPDEDHPTDDVYLKEPPDFRQIVAPGFRILAFHGHRPDAIPGVGGCFFLLLENRIRGRFRFGYRSRGVLQSAHCLYT